MAGSPRKLRIAQCIVCAHQDRARIEALRVGGASLDSLARQFNVSRDAVWRHHKAHVSPKRRAELTAGPAKVEQLVNAAADESKSLLDYLAITRSVLFNQFLTAAEAGDRPAVAHIAGRLLDSLRELGRLTGELREVSGISITNNTLNLTTSTEFAALSKGLLEIARAHPSARGDIVALLRGLDGTPEPTPEPPRPNGATRPLLMIEAEAVSVS